jgi:multidrug resistance efflux pump
MAVAGASRRLVVWISLAFLAVYVVWIAGPYLRSIIVRDAALTTWVNPVASPIAGYVDAHPLYPGERVGKDGRVVTVENPLADATELARARAELDGATGRLAALEELVGNLHEIVDSRRAQLAAFAVAFDQDLDAKILAAGNNMALIRQHLALEQAQAARLTKLAASGNASLASADAANAQAVEYQRTLEDMKSVIARATLRRQAADHDVFLLDDGTDAADALRNLDEGRLELRRGQADLATARSEIAADQAVVSAALTSYQRALSTPVVAPPGALVWSLIAAPGEAVQPGSPIAIWIDCAVMLVDAPVSDVELALLRKGEEADVILEGERRVRKGLILLTRGASATLGSADLAALAKGRTPGVGQVLVSLEASAQDAAACPIGEAASVDFPQVGFLDILLARLRL